MIKSVGIVGFGRFGQFFADHLKRDFSVRVWDVNADARIRATTRGITFADLADVCKASDALFLAVPINRFEAAVVSVAPHLRPKTTILDVCSVKETPAQVMADHLGALDVDIIATHPLFGPDSGAAGLRGLRLMMSPVTAAGPAYQFWREYFEGLGLRIIEMSPEEHDREAADSQSVTHYVGRVLQRLNLHTTRIDTRGFEQLLSVIDQTCNDSMELFRDLQRFNRFTAPMRRRLNDSMHAVHSQLVPARAGTSVVIGIQGGEGSFNDIACREYCASEGLVEYVTSYLQKTAPVLEALNDGQIDYGIFAVYNTAAGIVEESIEAMGRFPCDVIDYHRMIIRHALAIHPKAHFGSIDTVVSYPQPFKQCEGTLRRDYPHLRQVSTTNETEMRALVGADYTGTVVDQATWGALLAAGKLPGHVAVLMPSPTVDRVGLRRMADNLQDMGEDNKTTFAWVRRRRYDEAGE